MLVVPGGGWRFLVLAAFGSYMLFSSGLAEEIHCHLGTGMDNQPGPKPSEKCVGKGEKTVCIWEEDESGNIKSYGCTDIDKNQTNEDCHEYPDGAAPWVWRCWCKKDWCNNYNKPNPLGKNPKATGNNDTVGNGTMDMGNISTVGTTTSTMAKGDTEGKNPDVGNIFALAAMAMLASQIMG